MSTFPNMIQEFGLFSYKRVNNKQKIFPDAEKEPGNELAPKMSIRSVPKAKDISSFTIIRANDKFKLRWDLMIMILSIWNCFTIPVDIAFKPPAFQSLANQIFNHFIDTIFTIDILLNFRTTIILESTGVELTDPKKIAVHYLKGRFIVDLLATVPFDFILEGLAGKEVSGKLSLLSTLKIFRVLRLMKIISYLNASEHTKHSLKIFKLLFYLIIYIHC